LSNSFQVSYCNNEYKILESNLINAIKDSTSVITYKQKKIKILDEKAFKELGYLCFLTSWGNRINHNNSTGNFFTSVPSLDSQKIFVIRKNCPQDSILYEENMRFWVPEYAIYKAAKSIGKELIYTIDRKDFCDLLKSKITPYLSDNFFLKDEEVIAEINLSPQWFNQTLGKFLYNFDTSFLLDPLELFFFLLLRSKHAFEVVYFEANVKHPPSNWKHEKIDVVAYDKGKSDKLLLIELSTGHPAQRFLKKISDFNNVIKTLKNNVRCCYISRFPNLESKIFEETLCDHSEWILKILSDKTESNFSYFNISVEKENDLVDLDKHLRSKFDELLKYLDNVIQSMRRE